MKYIIIALAIVAIAAIGACSPRDDTDDLGGKRSGMSLHTDALTGCQYLSVPLGGMTPRVDGAGRHVGCKT